MRTLQDLQNVSPSLSFADAGLLKFANIRGVGLNLQSPTVVSGVATYRDGLFAPSPLFLNEGLFDIASVEVLRGPQGTFVGQNSTGGAIFQKSVTPTLGELDGYATLTVGSYDRVRGEGAISIPVTPTLSIRIAQAIEYRQSFYHNLGPVGDRPGRIRDEHGRLTILWQPDSRLTATLKVEANNGDGGGYPLKPLPGTRYFPLTPADPFTVNYDRTDLRRREFSLRTGLQLDYEFASGLILRSISGFQYGYQDYLNDTDATNANATYLRQFVRDYVSSEEINVISLNRGRFRWVLGGSYVRQVASLLLDSYNENAPFNGRPFPRQDTRVDTANPKNSFGVFAQGTLTIVDGLSVDLGGRYSRDTQSQRGTLSLLPQPPLPGVIDASTPRYEDNRFTGKAALNWQVNDNHLLYAFVANGFKSGGVILPVGTFAPERIVDYEAGWKATLANRHLRTQLNGFYMDYRDLQLSVFQPSTATSAIGNAGRSEIYGVEAQVQASVRKFSADLSLSYVHSRVGQLSLVDVRALPNGSATGLGVQCPVGVASNPPSCFNYRPFVVTLDGRPNPYSPRWTVNGGVQYGVSLGGDDTLTPRVDVSYLSSQNVSLFERPVLDVLGSRILTNAELTYKHRNLAFSAFVTNLTDEVYRLGNDTGNNTFFGAPRQFGARFNVNF